MRTVIYGAGGYDSTKPDGNVIEIIEVPDIGAGETIGFNQSSPITEEVING